MINRRNKENSKLIEKIKRILHGLISAGNFWQLEEICIEKFGKTTTITMRYFLPILCGIGSSYISKKAIKTSIISIGIIGCIYFMLVSWRNSQFIDLTNSNKFRTEYFYWIIALKNNQFTPTKHRYLNSLVFLNLFFLE